MSGDQRDGADQRAWNGGDGRDRQRWRWWVVHWPSAWPPCAARPVAPCPQGGRRPPLPCQPPAGHRGPLRRRRPRPRARRVRARTTPGRRPSPPPTWVGPGPSSARARPGPRRRAVAVRPPPPPSARRASVDRPHVPARRRQGVRELDRLRVPDRRRGAGLTSPSGTAPSTSSASGSSSATTSPRPARASPTRRPRPPTRPSAPTAWRGTPCTRRRPRRTGSRPPPGTGSISRSTLRKGRVVVSLQVDAVASPTDPAGLFTTAGEEASLAVAQALAWAPE